MNFHELPPVKDQLMKCVRCGKCRSVCPVFYEVKNETVAPRGHVFMVQMLRDNIVEPTKDVNDRLTSCLLCEACTVSCPSGIDIHELNAAARSYIYEKNPSVTKELVFDTLWTKPFLLRTSKKFMWGAQKLGLQKLARNIGVTKILPGDLSKAEQMLDTLPACSARSLIKEVNPAKGEKKYTVGYFLGCGTDLLQPDVALATIDVLTRNGVEVIVPKNTKCCGLPHIANSKIETAQKLMVHNIKIYNSYDFDYIITDCASCSAALSAKNMSFLFKGLKIEKEAMKFASKIFDLTKFLIDVIDIKLPSKEVSEKTRVTYHDPCHLVNAQGITSQPRKLLSRIPELTYIEMPLAARCCGGSGTYSVTHHDMSMKILDVKMDSAMSTGASVIATCCPSCMMQLSHGLRRHNYPAKIMHPIELVSKSYGDIAII